MIAAICLTVLLSVLAHGLSADPLARRYGAWVERTRPAQELPRGHRAAQPALADPPGATLVLTSASGRAAPDRRHPANPRQEAARRYAESERGTLGPDHRVECLVTAPPTGDRSATRSGLHHRRRD